MEKKNFKRGIGLLIALLFLSTSFLSAGAQEGSAETEMSTEVQAAAIQGDPVAGEQLYKQYCASCHKLESKLIGPALQGITERLSRDWLHKWIVNSKAVIESGDPYAVQIYEEYDQEPMTPFPQLSTEDVDNILAYIQKGPEKAAGPTPGGGNGQPPPSNELFLWILIIVLLVVIVVLSRVVNSLSRLVAEKTGEPVKKEVSFTERLKNKKVAAAAVIIALVLFGGWSYDFATDLGRQEGYAPEQPIKFSHKIHAGINGIDCQYCHVGVMKGKSAVIPSVNICMNCHKGITEGPTTGTEEIAKIHEAFNNNTPVKWVRVHNLPDHVFFSHAQHVNVGGIDCEKCHGDVREMDVLEQHENLSMGWCIDCHRETDVQFANNPYYDIYEQFHKDLKEGKVDMIKAADIGATECQRCHY